jgi:hypothetical protein
MLNAFIGMFVTFAVLGLWFCWTGHRQLRLTSEHPAVCIYDGGRLVLEYRYGDVPFKAYVKQFCSPTGINVLRDSPADHKHHHGLMFAIAAEGVDFWAEAPSCGRQVHRAFSESKTSAAVASFCEEIEWIGPKNDILLREQRTIQLHHGDDLGASLLTWRTKLRPGDDKKSIALSGSHYFGLGMRFLTSMDKTGEFTNADGKAGEIVRGDERVAPSAWCAYSASADDKPVTVAIFDHPDNPRHPATFFTMAQPFSYLSATLNLWKQPLSLDGGQSLSLCYGVAVCDGTPQPAQIEKLYQRWLTLTK